MGLSLQYGVAEYKIKNFNNLDNDDIYYRRELRIPNPMTNYSVEHTLEDEAEAVKKSKIHFFKQSVLKPDDQSDKVARYYLEEGDWDHYASEKLYNEDIEWEKKHNKLKEH